ncbi:MAG: hypothetical protein WAM30_10465 [Candidatus Dormiibacterota bacterium]
MAHRPSEADIRRVNYANDCLALRLPRAFEEGDRYTSVPANGRFEGVVLARIAHLNDRSSPRRTDDHRIWLPRIDDWGRILASHAMGAMNRSRPAWWYRWSVLRAIADACRRWPDASPEDAAARLYAAMKEIDLPVPLPPIGHGTWRR